MIAFNRAPNLECKNKEKKACSFAPNPCITLIPPLEPSTGHHLLLSSFANANGQLGTGGKIRAGSGQVRVGRFVRAGRFIEGLVAGTCVLFGYTCTSLVRCGQVDPRVRGREVS